MKPVKMFPILLLCMQQFTFSFGQSSQKDSVSIIVIALAKGNTYDETFTTGFAGSISKQFRLFEKLVLAATEQQLRDLTEHSNPVVRLYAYQALKRKNLIIPARILERFVNDSATITVIRGCILQKQQVRYGIRHKLISPYSKTR